ncbi:MAG: N-(5'-phosphoribosyl)anthranilate isomerase [Lentisphaerae bacterium ADurb.BinA184]|nr:MAG: N-(5'-phosphoribosyl)anthranilate isomerase [Lentisphaerae bacterium ADurb.BinA184]
MIAGIRVKVCGITRPADALAAVEAGADYIGLIFAAGSPRRVTPAQAAEIRAALPAGVRAVGVFVNAAFEEIAESATRCRLDLIQLHGDEAPAVAERLGPERVWKAVHLHDLNDIEAAAAYPAAALLVDSRTATARGGTGRTVNWDLAAALAQRRLVVLAGGLGPENVAAAVRRVHPFALDVNSGVESAPGRKDPARLAALAKALRSPQAAAADLATDPTDPSDPSDQSEHPHTGNTP